MRCKFRNFLREINFRETSHFVKTKPSQNGVITLSFTDIRVVKLCSSREYFTSQICLLTLIAKIKFSQKFPNLQYWMGSQGPKHSTCAPLNRRQKCIWICRLLKSSAAYYCLITFFQFKYSGKQRESWSVYAVCKWGIKTFQQTTKPTAFDVTGTLRVISDSVDAHAAQSHL